MPCVNWFRANKDVVSNSTCGSSVASRSAVMYMASEFVRNAWTLARNWHHHGYRKDGNTHVGPHYNSSLTFTFLFLIFFFIKAFALLPALGLLVSWSLPKRYQNFSPTYCTCSGISSEYEFNRCFTFYTAKVLCINQARKVSVLVQWNEIYHEVSSLYTKVSSWPDCNKSSLCKVINLKWKPDVFLVVESCVCVSTITLICTLEILILSSIIFT